MTAQLPHNPSNKDIPLGGIISLVVIAMAVILWIPVASYGDMPEAPALLYPKQLHYGVLNTLRGVDRADAQVAVEMNFDRVSDIFDPDFKVTLDFLSDVDTAAKLIRQKKLHALSLTGIDYFLLRKIVNVKPLSVASKLPASPIEPYVLLTRQNVTLNRLAGMANRRLIVDNMNHWDIGRIWLETVLADKGLPDSTRFFTSIQAAAKPIRMVLPVFFGQADVCLVPKSAYDTMVELNPQLGQKLHVLLQSPGFVKNIVCIADYLDPAFVDEMHSTLLNMHEREAGRQMMIIFQLRRNFPFQPDYLTGTEIVFHKYEKLKATQR